MPLDTLADLAGLTADGMTLDGATVTASADGTEVTVTGTATVLGLPGRAGVRMTVAGGRIVTEPSVSLDAVTLSTLATLGALPASSYAAADLPDVTFTDVAVAVGPERALTFTGTGPAAALPLGSDAVRVTGTVLTVGVVVGADGTAVNREAYVSGTLATGAGLPVRVELPRGAADWRVESTGDAAALTNGLADLAALAGLPVAGLLPGDLTGVSAFALSGVTATLSSRTGTISAAALTVGTTGTWEVLPGVLSVTGVTVRAGFTRWGSDVAAAGSVEGAVELFGVAVTVAVPIPPGDATWRLACYPGVTVPGIGDLVSGLASLAGAGDLAPSLPPGLDTLGGFVVDVVELDVDPSAATAAAALRRAGIRLSSAGAWTVPYVSGVTIGDVHVDLDVADPLAAHVVTGALGGTVYVGDSAIPVTVSRRTAASSWTLALSRAGAPVGLPDLLTLAGADATAFRAALPPGLGLLGTLGLTELAVEYDLTANALAYARFAIGTDAPWTVVEGILVVEDVGLLVEYVQQDDDTWTYLVRLGATIDVAGVGFGLTAANAGPAGAWLLTGAMTTGDVLSLTDLVEWLLGKLLAADFRLPASFPDVRAVGASVAITPATGAFAASLDSTVTWTLPFAAATLSIDSLHTAIDVGAAPETGTRPYAFAASGAFHLAGITGAASLRTTSGTDPTVVTVAVTTGTTVSLPDLVNGVVGGTTPAWGDAPAPPDLARPSALAEAGLTVDVTNDRLLAYGSYAAAGGTGPLYGAVALSVVGPPAGDTTTGHRYAVAAELRNWTFATLAAPLSVVDDALGVDRASAVLVLSQLDGADLAPLLAHVPGAGAGLPVRRGANVYARLDFSGGWLADVASVVGITTQGPFTVAGYVPAVAGASEFAATLGEVSLLGLLSFRGVTLTYRVGAERTYALTGTVVVHVDKDYEFAGDVTVVRGTGDAPVTTTTAHIATTGSIVRPLGIPHLTLGGLTFELDHVSGAASSDTQFSLSGDVTFTESVSLRGAVWFQGSAPVATVVSVTRLSVDDLFAAAVGSAWPQGLLDVTFRDGMLYYAPAAVTVTTTNAAGTATPLALLEGFHATVDADIYFLPPVHLDVTIGDAGIVASGGFVDAVDWGFVRFYRGPSVTPPLPADPAKGPAVFLDSAANTFTLSGGFGLFDTDIASLSVTVGKTAMTGRVQLDQDVPVFGKPALDFVWDDDGFRVTSWPLGNVKLPDFDFSNVPGTGGCPASGIVKIPIRSKVHLTPSLAVSFRGEGAARQPHLDITLTGSLDLEVASSAYPGAILSAAIGAATLSLPFPTGGFTWAALGTAFVDCITGAAASIFETILGDPANLAKLLAVKGIEWGVQAVTDFLVCKGASAAEAAAFVEAASGAVASTVSILGAVVAVGGVVGHRDSDGNHHDDSGSSSGGGGGPPPVRPAAPAAPTLAYADGVLTITWATVDGATAYVVVLQADGTTLAQTAPSAATTATLPVTGAATTYTARVVASGPGGVSDAGAPASISGLGAVGLESVVYAGGNAVATWTDVVPGAETYEGVLVGPDGATLGSEASAPAAGLTLSLPVPDAVPAWPLSVKVRAASPTAVTGAWSPASGAIERLDVPGIGAPSCSLGRVAVPVTTTVGSADAYAAQVTTPEGAPLGQAEAVPYADPRADVSVAGLAAGTYGVRVRAVGNGYVPSEWVQAPGTFTIVTKPVVLSARCDGGSLTATWSGVSNAYEYELRAALPPEERVTQVPSDGEQARYDGSVEVPPPGWGPCVVTVRGVGQGADESSDPVTVVVPAVPASLAVVVRDHVPFLTWQPVDGATYEVVVRGAGPDPVTSRTTATELDVSHTAPAGAALTAAVRAVGPDGGGSWSGEVSFRLGTGHPATLAIEGDGQSVAREGLDPPGGIATFAPLRVLVVDGDGVPLPNVTVSFEAQPGSPRLAVQLDPGGQRSVIRTTGLDGTATLDAMGGSSVRAYYADGPFTVSAKAPALLGAVVLFSLTVAPSPPRPPLPGATLSVVAGDGQQVARSGMYAMFAPLRVRVLDASGAPAAGALVDFAPGDHPPQMAVQVHPSGASPATVVAGADGVATLDVMPNGVGVYAYYATGPFTVVASVVGGGQASFALVVTG